MSKLCGLPSVSELLASDGTPKDADHRMLKQLPDLLTQLEWMAVAMKNQRLVDTISCVCTGFYVESLTNYM